MKRAIASGLDFKQYSFNHMTRVLRHLVSYCLESEPLFCHAVVPSAFRLQVRQMTPESFFQF